MQVLAGVHVVDFSRVLAGPYCAQLLSDMGADVIKIESPQGDENRRWQPIMPNGQSSNFASVNRGKRSLTLDMKSPHAPEVVRRLALQADVMLHNFLPGTARRLGLDYDKLRALNPRLVYCTINGYGHEGPLADKPGYDLMMQAYSGMMSTTGEPGGPPLRTGVSCIDMATGMSAYGGIVTALLARERSGEGARVRASLLETAISFLGYHAIGWLQAGVLPVKQGSGSASSVPYQAFACKDGHILMGAPNEGAWNRFCKAIAADDLAADPRFQGNENRVAHREVLVAILEVRFAAEPMAHWVERLEAHGVAVAALHSLDQVLTHPQVKANAMVLAMRDDDGSELPGVGMPFKVSREEGPIELPPAPPPAPPRLGAHSEAILRDTLGFSEEDVAAMRAAGAI